MVRASHVIFSAYGFWLPNDPRGSWSDFVRSWDLLRFGRATKTEDRLSVAWDSHDRNLRIRAKEALDFPPVQFTGVQARAVGQAFGAFCGRRGIIVHACSILPEHVHMVIARHEYHVEQIVNLLNGEATRQIVAAGIHPLAEHRGTDGKLPRMWGRGLWKVFLDSPESVDRAIQYVEENPEKEGLPKQKWAFVSRPRE